MQVDLILKKASDGHQLSFEEIEALLSLTSEPQLKKVFEAARTVREKHFQNKVFLYGFIYFSTYCRNNCSFCYYRKTNSVSPRYRKTLTQSIKIASELAASGVHLIDLTMGEDPFFHETKNLQILFELVRNVKQKTKLPIMISPGLLSNETLSALKEAGADWYAVYQETHNRELFSQQRLSQNYDARMAAKSFAKELGLLIEEGILLGLGEKICDIANSIVHMQRLGVRQARVMSLVPQPGTPLANQSPPPRYLEMLTIAVMRLTLKDVLIPASLDIEGIAGLTDRLMAGANVVTSIIPPNKGLVGVSQSELDIDAGFRTVAGVKAVLPELGLEVAPKADYIQWLNNQDHGLEQKEIVYHETGNHRRAFAGS